MKKFKKTLAVISAITAISLSALPVSAFCENPIEENCSFDYISRYGGYATGYNDVRIYDNGMALSDYKCYKQYVLTPADGVTLTAKLLSIPDKYTLETDNDTNEVFLPVYEDTYDNSKIFDELEVCIRAGLRKGIIAKAEIEQTVTGKCFSEPRLAIILKDGTDIDEFIADYPEYELTTDNSDVPEEYKNYQLFTRVAEEEEVSDISNKGFRDYISCDMVRVKKYGNSKENRRIKLTNYFGKTCDEVHSISQRKDFEDEYAYFENPENIAWEGNTNNNFTLCNSYRVYKNGRVYSEFTKNVIVKFNHKNGNYDGLPDKYKVQKSYTDEFDLIGFYNYNNEKDEDDLNEVIEIVKKWAEKGIIENPEIERYYTHTCGDVWLDILLKNADDIDAFKADYPEYSFTQTEYGYYENDPRAIAICDPKTTAYLPEIQEKLAADSRIESTKISGIFCEVCHTLADDPEPISGYQPYTGTILKGDISGNGKIDIYDAIEIAKSLVTRRVFTEEEMEIADYNSDGKVDLYDAIGIAEYIIRNK